MYRELPYLPTLPTERRLRGLREVTAAFLRALGATLHRLAAGLAARDREVVARHPVLEFYAEAGAPEGALYLDGELVGRVEGVSRL